MVLYTFDEVQLLGGDRLYDESVALRVNSFVLFSQVTDAQVAAAASRGDVTAFEDLFGFNHAVSGAADPGDVGTLPAGPRGPVWRRPSRRVSSVTNPVSHLPAARWVRRAWTPHRHHGAVQPTMRGSDP